MVKIGDNSKRQKKVSQESAGTSIDLVLTSGKIQSKPGSKFGRGVFAMCNIQKGEVICEMQGPLISKDEHIKKYGSLMFTDPLQIEEELYIDLVEPFRSFNHSCEPNAGMRDNGLVFALKDIKVGEEIFFDYSTTCDDLWSMECGCDFPSCRKVIARFMSLSTQQQTHYLDENAVLQYIRNLYS